MTTLISKKGSGRIRLAAVGSLAIVLTLGLSACDDFLDVTDPDRVDPGTLQSEEATGILVASAIGEILVAWNGTERNNDGFVSNTAVFTDEFLHAGTFPTRLRSDKRDWFDVSDGNTPDETYQNLHQARRAALFAQLQLDKFEATRGADWALMRTLEAYTYVAFGEAWCGAVPFTEFESVVGEAIEVVPGSQTPLNNTQMFNAAITRFDEALGVLPGDALARIGKARAQLNLGQAANAAATVAGLSTNFIHFIEHGETAARQNNGLESLFQAGRYTVSDFEGINGIGFRTANDPRVPFIRVGNGFDRSTPKYWSLKASVQDANLVLADGVEARLIEAEAAHAAGNFSSALTILNALRESTTQLMENRVTGYAALDVTDGYVFPPELEALTDPGTDAARLDLIFSERAMWLYLTGHRLGDMRRLVVNYGRAVNSVFPTGDYPRRGGGTYGNSVSFFVHFNEANNPDYDATLCNTNSF